MNAPDVSPMLKFGRWKGKTVEQVSTSYCRWLADPQRDVPSPPRPGRAAGGHRPLPKDIVDAARERIVRIDAAEAAEKEAKRLLSGGTHAGPDPLYVVECEGDLHSLSGTMVFDMTTHATLGAALAVIDAEYPRDPDEPSGRSTPDPEDDRILVWEVLPTGHRRAVWGFFGWHHSSDEFDCGPGTLPGDDEDLYSLAMKDS